MYTPGAMQNLQPIASILSQMIPPIAVVFLAVVITGCNADAPTGTYSAACDSSATIDFEGNSAIVTSNFCEGYGVEKWDYTVDGDTLELTLGSRDPVVFRITGPEELKAIKNTDGLTCGNCVGGEVWTRK